MLTTKDTKAYNLYYSIYRKYLENEKLRCDSVCPGDEETNRKG